MRATHRSAMVALLLAVGAGACTQAEVPDPTERAEQALEQADLSDVNVDWDREARVAHLKGTVDSAEQRDRAHQVATTAIGTAGKVLNEIEVEAAAPTGTSGHLAAGSEMDGRVRDALNKLVDDDQVLRDRDIDFDVNNGAVTVKGEVRTAAEKTKVTGLVKSVPGVKDFANALEVKPKR